MTLGWSATPGGRLRLRRMVSRVLRGALRIRSRPLPHQAGSPVLVISPHPDDETLGCGGLLALLAGRGAQVHVAFVTDGGASHPSHPQVSPAEIAARRIAEARMATGILGVDPSHLSFLEARDGTLARLDPARTTELVTKARALVERIRPQLILLPCRRDGSSEHEATFRTLRPVLEEANPRPRILEFPVWSWWNPLLLIRPYFTYRRVWRVDIRESLDVKARALASYATQILPIPPETTATLPPGFTAPFLCGEEFYFEN
jgi:LmbE family N-acetylglucosaminyl deacetylase